MIIGSKPNAGYNYSSMECEVDVRFYSILRKRNLLFVYNSVKKLEQLHNRHFARPDFDENSSEEKEIESITKDITSVYI